MKRRNRFQVGLTLAACLALAPSVLRAATVTILSGDPAGVGFNDPTPVGPVGGNSGTTLGQQRMIAFQAAANKWGATLASNVVIRVTATWTAMTCTAYSAVLGRAGPTEVFKDFAGAPVGGHWYAKALANKIAGIDMDGNNVDITANFNVSLGQSGCLSGVPFYLGLDNNHGGSIDLIAVVTHELAHGLGYQTFTDGQSGAQLGGVPSIWDDFLLDNTTNKTWTMMTASERVASAVNNGHLVWNGGNVSAAIPLVLQPQGSSYTGADSQGRGLMYAPGSYLGGSSISHFDTSMFRDQLMEPAIHSDLTHEVTPPYDLTFSLLKDIGWTAGSVTVPALTISKTHTGNFTQGQTGAAYTLTVSNQAGAGATSGTVTVTETVPSGLTLMSMAGTGWTCPGGNACTRGDVLNGGAGYPVIAVTVNVAATAPSLVTNQASVSGGGSAMANASDNTAITAVSSVPGQVALTLPGSGAANQSTTPTLSWSASTNATSYDLYLGTSNPPAVYAQNLSATSFVVSTALNAGTTYFWNVVAKNGVGSAPASSTWPFMTASLSTSGGLIGYWNFDEGSGGIAHDTSGGGHNGAVNGAAWTTGKINTGLRFNGSSNSVITSPTAPIALGAAFSISAWVNPTVTPQVGYVRIAETYYATGFYLGTDTTGTKYKLIVNGGSGVTGSCGYGCAEGGTISSGWHLVTATFDGATARLYVDNAVVGSDTFSAPSNTNLPLNIGISYTGSGYGWNGAIDEVRLYNRGLSSAEVSAIYNNTGGPPDSTPPSTPGNVSATAVFPSQINVSWSASTDNVGVAGYRLFRNGTLAGTVTTLSYSDTGLAASTTYSYTVSAFDAAGNVSGLSTAAMATTGAVDSTPPSVSITAPSANSTVSNTITVTATASDNVAVGDVQFQLDGVNLGADLTSAPYTISWNTATASNGSHNLTAIARDTSHNPATSAVVQVTVNNTVTGPPSAGLTGYWNFDEGSGSVAHDTSGGGYDGAVNGAAWTTGKINTGLRFTGANSVITPTIAVGGPFSVSAWVNPAAAPQIGYVRIAETYYATGFYLGTDTTGTKYKLIVNGGAGVTGTCGYGCAEGGTISSGWHLVTATFDGTTARLYVDNAVVGSDTFTAPSNTSLQLHIGVAYTGSGSGWNGTIDEVRLYNRGLSSAEVSAIYSYTGGPPDSTPPSTPGNVSATAVSPSQINISWSASTDNVGVAGYRVFRNGTLAGTVTALSYSDTGLAASTTYSYTVSAFDAAGNVSGLSTAATATTLAIVDTTPPSVSITAPAANSTVSNTITVTATATDNVAVGDVQFQLDGVNLGADLTSAPYTISWNTATASNGSHNLTAIARDTSHNSTTSAVVQVTVNNTVSGPSTSGLIGYWNFDEGSGSAAHDTSGGGHNGAVNGAAWMTGKINTGLQFNGSSNSVITPAIALAGPFSFSAWVNPAVAPQIGYVRIAETNYATGFYLGTDTTGTKYKLIVNGGAGVTGTCGYGCAEGGTISSGWHLVTATFDGTTARLYVDNAVVGSDTFTAPSTASLQLHMGVAYTGSGSGWNGTIDEVRLYNRGLSSAEVSAIYSYTGGPPDSTPPSTPGNVSATAVSPSQINVSWSASTDNVGVAGYRLFRNGTLAGTVATLSYSDTGLAASTTYSYTVSAFDAAGNVSGLSTAATATTGAVDTTPPSVSITAPSANSTVSNTITVTATASDNVAVGDVQFQLDGVNLGADLTSAPYTISWNTATASNGSHNLTAIARDTSHNSTTSAVVQVTVNNTVTGPPSGGLIGYWNFDEGSGSIAHDTSGGGHDGAVNGAAWTTGKINTGLRFTGTSSAITPAFALGAPFSISAWVNPSVIPQVGYVRIAETHYATGFYLGTDTTGTKYKLIVNGGSGITGSCSYGCAEGGTISSGWHLVTATFDGATARLYVDNAVVGSDTFTPSTASLPFNIGVAYTGSGYGWNGTIDEVRLYNRALTAAEVNAIFNY